MNKGKVLLVDDDTGIQVVVSQYLEDNGYKVTVAGGVSEAIEFVDSGSFDVILLDLGLPDGEGLGLIAQLKPKTDAAILVVSGKTDTTEKILCLEMGADDYLTKPFEMRELSARLTAVNRRISPIASTNNTKTSEPESRKERVTFGEGFVLDRSQYQVFDRNGDSLDLTTGEFKLLDALISAPKRTLSREQLFDLTREGGSYDVYDRAIDIQIARLRKKLNSKDNPNIKTVRGVGYMFIGNL